MGIEHKNARSMSPSQKQINTLLKCYEKGQIAQAEKLSLSMTQEFPQHEFGWKVLGVIYGMTGKYDKAVKVNQMAVLLSPQDAVTHNNLANTLQALGRFEDAKASYEKAILIDPYLAEAYSNLGITHKELGNLEDSISCFEKAISLKPNFVEALNGLGITFQTIGKSEKAELNFLKAVKLNPNFADAFWNLHGIQRSLNSAEYYIDKCLKVENNHIKARITKAALRYYQGEKYSFNILNKSNLKKHPYMRSYAWAFSLPNLPELYFNRWHFFDTIIKKSIVSKPFYEFGVWRASSFKYIIKYIKKGYGFDTFEGLPEDWNVGGRSEKKGSYSSDGIIPKIKGGEFIKGKFEDTLPIFFSKNRPIASVMNFDADLYSSTICALNYSKNVMDKNTILIFDELLMNESWEHDEFKALNEFCSANNLSYEVIAISFYTKQVAIKLIGL